MTEPPVGPPPPIPPDPYDEPVRSKERHELFPDEPAGRPAWKKDNVESVENEQLRQRSENDDRIDRIRRTIRDTFTLEGRVLFRVDGEDVMTRVFSCNKCKALIAKDDVESHFRWHERLENSLGKART